MLYVSISTSQQCQLCRNKMLRFIQTETIPFKIHQSDGSSVIVGLHNPTMNIDGMLNE